MVIAGTKDQQIVGGTEVLAEGFWVAKVHGSASNIAKEAGGNEVVVDLEDSVGLDGELVVESGGARVVAEVEKRMTGEIENGLLVGGRRFVAYAQLVIIGKQVVDGKGKGENSLLRTALGNDWKGKSSPVVYAVGIVSAAWSPMLAQSLYVLMALVWLIPDTRIEKALATTE